MPEVGTSLPGRNLYDPFSTPAFVYSAYQRMSQVQNDGLVTIADFNNTGENSVCVGVSGELARGNP